MKLEKHSFFQQIGISLFLALLFLLPSCEKNTTYHSYRSIPFHGWDKADTLIYTLSGNLTGKTYQVEIGVRHNETYPFRDLWIEIHHPLIPHSPHERIHLYLADKHGNWKGTGTAGNLYQYTAKGLKLELQPGDSILQITHIMNTSPLQGISDIGIRLSFPRGVNPQKDKQ